MRAPRAPLMRNNVSPTTCRAGPQGPRGEWQGCESPQLERGAREIARELFGDAPHIDLGLSDCDSLDSRNGVFALDCVLARFYRTMHTLQTAAPERVFTVGGTCGSEAAPVAYLAGRNPGIGVVWLDAHGDLNTPATSPSGHFHGMVLRTLLGDGPPGLTDHIASPLEPARVVVVGVRDLDVAEREYADSVGLALIEAWPEDTATRIVDSLRSADVTRIYVHVDVDVFDPSAYGDALFLVPGGPSMDSVASVARVLVDAFDVLGVGVVESCGREIGAPRAMAGFLSDSGLLQAE